MDENESEIYGGLVTLKVFESFTTFHSDWLPMVLFMLVNSCAVSMNDTLMGVWDDTGEFFTADIRDELVDHLEACWELPCQSERGLV